MWRSTRNSPVTVRPLAGPQRVAWQSPARPRPSVTDGRRGLGSDRDGPHYTQRLGPLQRIKRPGTAAVAPLSLCRLAMLRLPAVLRMGFSLGKVLERKLGSTFWDRPLPFTIYRCPWTIADALGSG